MCDCISTPTLGKPAPINAMQTITVYDRKRDCKQELEVPAQRADNFIKERQEKTDKIRKIGNIAIGAIGLGLFAKSYARIYSGITDKINNGFWKAAPTVFVLNAVKNTVVENTQNKVTDKFIKENKDNRKL